MGKIAFCINLKSIGLIPTIKTIFITIPWFTPAFQAGGPIQSIANLVNDYKDARFFIFCGNTDLNETALAVETDKWVKYNAYTQVWYAPRTKRSELLIKQIDTIKPDVLFIVGIFSWHFNMVPLLFGKAKRKIISVRGMLHEGALTQKKTKKRAFLSLWKFFDWHRKAVFHATDEAEKEHIIKMFGEEVEISVVSNYTKRLTQKYPDKKKGLLKLVSVGLISPMKNHLLILQALAQTPAVVEYKIYGPIKEMAYWQSCLDEMKELPVNISVNFYGGIPPEHVEQVLHENHVFILPSKSESFGHAMVEALSTGKPVITSHNTPWQNLKESKAGINVNANVSELSDAILHFSEMDSAAFEKWSDGALQYAHASINNDLLAQQYDTLFTVPVKD